MKTQITCHYEESPAKEDKLLISNDAKAWIEKDDNLYKIISDQWDEELQEGKLIVEVNLPEKTCRFLGHSDGSAPACYGFGNVAAGGQPWHMECAPNGFAPEIVCLHCAEYAFERQERKHQRTTRLNDHGIIELLPELHADELGKYADESPFHYVDRATGEVA